MKSILKVSFVLLFFSLSVVVFQISCQKEVSAQNPNTVTNPPKNKLVYEKTIQSGGGQQPVELWTCNYDGSGQQRINISLPAGLFIDGNARISPDGQKLFFNVVDATLNYIYSCNIDGSGLTRILTQGSNETYIGVDAAF